MKKLFLSLLATLLLFGTTSTANAEENYVPMRGVDANELANLPYEETYSYEEVLADMENNNLISKEEVNAFKARQSKILLRSYEEVRYTTFYCDSYTFKAGSDYNAKTYVLEPRIYVGLIYVNNGDSPYQIASLDAPFIYTGGGTECKFAGNIFYRLEAGNRFFMGINGDVYKTATITTKLGVKVGIGDSSNISFEISYANDYLKNVAWDYKYYSAGMTP